MSLHIRSWSNLYTDETICNKFTYTTTRRGITSKT